MTLKLREGDALRLSSLEEELRAARAAWNLHHSEHNRQQLIMARARYATLAAQMGQRAYHDRTQP